MGSQTHAQAPLELDGQAGKTGSSTQKHPTADVSNPVNFLKRIMSTKRGSGEASSKPPTPLPGMPEAPSDLASSYENISHPPVGKQQEYGNGTSGKGTPMTALQKTKLVAFERLRRFGGPKQAGKDSKDKNIEFPPPSWNIDEGTGMSAQVMEDVTKEGEAASSRAVDGIGEGNVTVIPPEQAPSPNDDMDDAMHVKGEAPPESPEGERTEPTSLARRIQMLLSSMPRVSFSAPSPQEPPASPSTIAEAPKPPDAQSTAPSQFPEPNPASAALINDSKLISLLSSASVMNGSISKGRESVWTILDRLGWSRAGSTLGVGGSKGKEKAGEKQDEDLNKVAEGDREVPGSEDVMLYAPLEPDDASIVEVARSEVVEVTDDEGTVVDGASDSEAKVKEVSASESKSSPNHELDKSDKKGKGKAIPDKPKPTKEKVVWVPSATKISVQATWWGYRIYLPPPVMRVMNSKSMEAAKRATLITTALKWLLDHIPTTFLPIQVRPAATLLKRLVPLLGYIGAFIAWSWGAIRTFDRGYGVILSATWLLPVALIPGSWDESDFPKVEGLTPAPVQASQPPYERRFW